MLGGKRRGQPLVATSADRQETGGLLDVTDRESRLRFLVDTGSEVSITPLSKAEWKIGRIHLVFLRRTICQL